MQSKTIYTILTCLTLSSLLAACGGGSSSDDDDNAVADNSSYATFDASSDIKTRVNKPVFFDLSSGHVVTKDDNWHISYQKYRGFVVNGGISGKGNVKGCIAKAYPQLYTQPTSSKPEFGKHGTKKPVKNEFGKLTAANTLADFNQITKESCTDFKVDSIDPLIKQGYWLDADYSKGAPIFSAKTGAQNGWVVRSAKKINNSEHYSYAKVKVKTVTYTSNPVKRAIVLQSKRYDGTNKKFADTWADSPELDFTSKRVYWDLETNQPVAATDDWELSITKNGISWDIQVNSSVSGSGDAALGVLQVAFDKVGNPESTEQVYKYFTDKAKGTLSSPGDFGPFQYGIYGEHRMTPNYTIYLIKDGSKIYKLQILGNYGKDGKAASANIYFRYLELIN